MLRHCKYEVSNSVRNSVYAFCRACKRFQTTAALKNQPYYETLSYNKDHYEVTMTQKSLQLLGTDYRVRVEIVNEI